jgi:hypothetical protein
LVTTTLAFGMTAPLASLTVPEIVPVGAWARIGDAAATNKPITPRKTGKLRISLPSQPLDERMKATPCLRWPAEMANQTDLRSEFSRCFKVESTENEK